MISALKEDSGESVIQEVSVYFGSKLLRGNRAHKQSAHSFDAIVSPNYPSLVDAGVDFKVNHSALYRTEGVKLSLKTRFESQITWLPFSLVCLSIFLKVFLKKKV